jgi:hypothetical protein
LRDISQLPNFFKCCFPDYNMNIQRVKQGARLTYWNGVYTILVGIFYIVFSNFFIRQSFKSISESWGFFLRYNPRIAYLFILLNILIGVLMISNGLFITYLSDFIIKRKEKITWVILLVSGIIGWVGLLLVSILLENVTFIVLSAIGWISFVIGMILPIKYYLEKNYREY